MEPTEEQVSLLSQEGFRVRVPEPVGVPCPWWRVRGNLRSYGDVPYDTLECGPVGRYTTVTVPGKGGQKSVEKGYSNLLGRITSPKISTKRFSRFLWVV